MISRNDFLRSLTPLRGFLKSSDAGLANAIEEAFIRNPWFYPDFTRYALDAFADKFLDREICETWLNQYPVSDRPGKKIAIVMAGNVPLVGFHDLFCVLASGHEVVIKLSDKDSVLPLYIMKAWMEMMPGLVSSVSFTERLEGFDAVIATGSNNTSRYFEYYFRSYPHILRRNRNGVAILSGVESKDDLEQLGKDIFLYYGLGCRNVSKIYVPENYNFSKLENAFGAWNYLADHNKYRNNLDYNSAIFIINTIPHINFGQLILKEDDAITSRIGCLHYSYYADPDVLSNELNEKRNEIQCLVKNSTMKDWRTVRFGETQRPALDQYADDIDTMQFLLSL